MRNIMKNRLFLLILVIILLATVSCKHTNQVTVSPEVPPTTRTNTAVEMFNSLLDNEFTCNTLKCKFSAAFTSINGIQGAKGTLQYDNERQSILVNATVFGINVLSVLIYSDSLLIVNKLSKTYINEPLDVLYSLYGVRINEPTVEDLLFGRVLYDYCNKRVMTLDLDNGIYNLHLGNYPDYNVFIPKQSLRIIKAELNAFFKGKDVLISYPAVYKDNGKSLPSQIDFSFNDDEFSCTVNLSQLEIDSERGVNVNVKIPSNYEKARL